MTIPRLIVPVVLTLIIITMLFAVFHKRIVRRGSFDGFVIGESKQDILMQLHDRPDLSVIDIFDPMQFSISKGELDRIDRFDGVEAIQVWGPGVSGIFFLSDARVDKVNSDLLAGEFDAITVGTSLSNLKDELRNFLDKDALRGAMSRVRGYRPDLMRIFVDAKVQTLQSDPEAIGWLMKQDIWSLKALNSYKRYRLFFLDNKLKEIEYTNYFVELP
ncbi:hypothetical protein [Aliiroseovarius lamellibrachiae]|uniref:hypothetical protein n=1 Tax=Aliiroseovarius lamellibrachiae TaxID=1924933 RepID=UPI001BE02983|nr:hypothetical protein [Aliiroseovarius lamellibrachiae]MBT2132694.1 hypothetical protein [Aliiroseovarius lamellibrachiae]